MVESALLLTGLGKGQEAGPDSPRAAKNRRLLLPSMYSASHLNSNDKSASSKNAQVPEHYGIISACHGRFLLRREIVKRLFWTCIIYEALGLSYSRRSVATAALVCRGLGSGAAPMKSLICVHEVQRHLLPRGNVASRRPAARFLDLTEAV
jgi:hypothetical protein